MTALIDSPPPRSRHRRAGRIIERTTTVTREVYVDYPIGKTGTSDRTDCPALSPGGEAGALSDDVRVDASASVEHALSGMNRFAVEAGMRIAEWGRRRAARRSAHVRIGGAEISRRLDRSRERDMALFTGIPR